MLKEERTAIINQAVTKGLNPNAKMKDSGIEWLGEIPQHWKVLPLKHMLLEGKEGIKIGPFGSALKLEIMKDSGFKVYGQENVIKNDFSVGNKFIDGDKFQEMGNYELKQGDIVVTMMGTTGKSKVVPSDIQKGIMDSHLIRMRLKSEFNPLFISMIINNSYCAYTQFKIESKGSIMEGLNSTIIKSLLIPISSITEQASILKYIDTHTAKIDKSIFDAETQIDFLKEYRTALISEAVTGKIDVR